jgi:hypothetical protein
MTSLFDIRDKAQQAEGRQPDGVQLQLQPAEGIAQGGSSEALPAARRTLPPFTSADGRKNYRAIYRAVCEYHERNNPPRLTLEYWERAANDISATANSFSNDPFVFALLSAVYDELEREYKKLEAGREGEENAF